ncbi:alanine aminotransferase 2-like [Bolinopsis microptera]|uniref:alanine aminotransferase 2-like n=1 Tax=Bolinopsis microptera TaxID=2820187 RepID=UPI00307ADAA2
MAAVRKAASMLNLSNMNPCVKEMQYAVRGPIVIRAAQLEKELKSGKSMPFEQVIRANIGDAHAMGQKPISFVREVISLSVSPNLMKTAPSCFTNDAIQRATEILENVGGQSMGSYTDSPGIVTVRNHVAEYISERDGYPASPDDIFVGTGASSCIKNIMKLCLTMDNESRPGFMIPVPQYPLYSACTAEFNAELISYYMDEHNNWTLNPEELERAYDEAKSRCVPKAICVINPGNPTGQNIPPENIVDIIKFAHKHDLLIMADEVYQTNIWGDDDQFVSFKKVLRSLGPEYDSQPLASFHSVSKGFMGECGLRGGYCEMTNFDPEVKVMLQKLISASLCSSTSGQVAISCMVKAPSGDAAELYKSETEGVLASLKERSILVHEKLNEIPGIVCNNLQGAMYAFPRIEIPKKAIELAESKGVTPDFFYCLELLENTGICVVPGSGFWQYPGTFHFRMTILPPMEQLVVFLEKLAKFHVEFREKYG